MHLQAGEHARHTTNRFAGVLLATPDFVIALADRRPPDRPRLVPFPISAPVSPLTTYAAGLRVSEVVRLQLTDLDRERLMIRVEQGKRRTDRSTILSPRLLTELDRSRAPRSLTRWLFPAHAGDQPMSPSTAQHLFVAAKVRAGIQKPGSIHLLRHHADCRIMPTVESRCSILPSFPRSFVSCVVVNAA